MYKITLIFFLGLTLGGCEHRIQSEGELHHWLNDETHGLIRSKTINDFTLTIKYLPKEYLILKELKSVSSSNQYLIDSLAKQYENALAFLMTIKLDEGERDIMYEGVSNYIDYKQRVIDLNFDMGEYVYLKTPTGKCRPILSTLENSYSLVGHRSIYLLFGDCDAISTPQNQDTLDLVFEDEIFETGINHFLFKKEDLQNIPSINYASILSKNQTSNE